MDSNNKVLIRDHMAGVFVGNLQSVDLAQKTWTLKNARKIHSWSKTFTVEGITIHGVGKDSNLTAIVKEVSGSSLVQIIHMSDSAFHQVMEYAEHRP